MSILPADHTALAQAELEWDDHDQPLSSRYDDVYFSRDNGLAEATHVFINGNHLPERWSRLSAASGTFTIGETGFGTGLSFLIAARLWLERSPAHWQLHFISTEKHPLRPADFQRALRLWPELSTIGKELAALLPLPLSGCHRRTLAGGRIRLSLLYGDSAAALDALAAALSPCHHPGHTGVDAWFLDGFAPTRNSDMWTSQLYSIMSRLSRSDATVATFTAAGHVRRGLIEAGFTMAKQPGYGTKREMLSGQISAPPESLPPWRETPWFVAADRSAPGTRQERRATIIGAGIAGCSTAAALAQRGWQITLIDRHAEPGLEASGNPQGILYPRLSLGNAALPRFALQALLHAYAWYAPYWNSGYPGARCGVLLLPDGEQQREEFAALAARFAGTGLTRWLDGAAVRACANIPLAADRALYLPDSGWVAPQQVCRWLVDHPNIRFIQAEINHIEQDEQQRWQLSSQGQKIDAAPILVLANAVAVRHFPPTAHLPLRVIRGQISFLPDTELTSLRTVLCGRGYLAPAADGHQTLGATYDPDDSDLTPRLSDHHRNLDTLATTDTALRAPLEASGVEMWQARVAQRCTTPDYMPLIGPAPQYDSVLETYADLRRDARRIITQTGPNLPGLYIHCALGSRGLTYAPLGAEYLADLIEAQPPSLSLDLQQAIHPARFLIRDLKKKRL